MYQSYNRQCLQWLLCTLSAFLQAEASGRGATAAEGQGSKQQPQQRRPQQAVGEVQHNQAAVKHKLLERLADDVRLSTLTVRLSYA